MADARINRETATPFPKRPNVDGRSIDCIWTDDALNAKRTGDILTKDVQSLLDSERKCGVVALCGDFGVGKTFLLDRWSEQQKQAGWVVKKHNLDLYEFDDEPLRGLLISMFGGVTETKDVIKELAKTAADGISKKLSGVSSKSWVNAFYNSGQCQWLNDKTVLNALRKHLVKLAANHDGGNPLVVVVDELDRCNPDHALVMLKRLRTMLSSPTPIPGLVFVIGVNNKALEMSIRARFGKGFKAHEFLRPLFTTTIQLIVQKKSPWDSEGESEEEVFNHYVKKYGWGKDPLEPGHFFQSGLKDMEELRFHFCALMRKGRFSARHMDDYFSFLTRIVKSIPEKRGVMPMVISPLAALRIVRKSEYDQFLEQGPTAEALTCVLNVLVDLYPEDHPQQGGPPSPIWRTMAAFLMMVKGQESDYLQDAPNLLRDMKNWCEDAKNNEGAPPPPKTLPKFFSGEPGLRRAQKVLKQHDRLATSGLTGGVFYGYGTMMSLLREVEGFVNRPERQNK